MNCKKALVLFVISAALSFNVAFGQDAAKKALEVKAPEVKAPEIKAPVKEAVKEAVKDAAKEVAKVDPKSPCACAEPGKEELSKAYDSLEEDDWTAALKVIKDASSKVAALQKTCKCPDLDQYIKVLKAYDNYATATNDLDNSEKIDCPKVSKLYDEAVKLLEEAGQKLSTGDIKDQANDIKEYAAEELEYAKEECSGDSE